MQLGLAVGFDDALRVGDARFVIARLGQLCGHGGLEHGAHLQREIGFLGQWIVKRQDRADRLQRTIGLQRQCRAPFGLCLRQQQQPARQAQRLGALALEENGALERAGRPRAVARRQHQPPVERGGKGQDRRIVRRIGAHRRRQPSKRRIGWAGGHQRFSQPPGHQRAPHGIGNSVCSLQALSRCHRRFFTQRGRAKRHRRNLRQHQPGQPQLGQRRAIGIAGGYRTHRRAAQSSARQKPADAAHHRHFNRLAGVVARFGTCGGSGSRQHRLGRAARVGAACALTAQQNQAKAIGRPRLGCGIARPVRQIDGGCQKAPRLNLVAAGIGAHQLASRRTIRGQRRGRCRSRRAVRDRQDAELAGAGAARAAPLNRGFGERAGPIERLDRTDGHGGVRRAAKRTGRCRAGGCVWQDAMHCGSGDGEHPASRDDGTPHAKGLSSCPMPVKQRAASDCISIQPFAVAFIMALPMRRQQEFDIAFRAGDRAGRDAIDLPALRAEPVGG